MRLYPNYHKCIKRALKFSVVSPLSVVSLKIGNNNCKPGETYRKTPSICKIPTRYRANFAEDRHQHSRGGLSKSTADSTRKCNSPSGEERQAALDSVPFKAASKRGSDERRHAAHPGRTLPDRVAFVNGPLPKRDCRRAEASQVHDQP